MRTINRRKEINPNNQKLNIIVILIYFIFLFILEFCVFRAFLREESLNFSYSAKTNIFFIAMNESFVLLSYALCSKWIFILICGIIYNFSTVYKLFIFIENILITCFIISIFQLILKDELVYYNEKINFPIKYCVTFFGTPSVFATLSTVAVFTLRHLFVLDGFLNKYKRVYLVSFIACLIYIIFVNLINLFSFINSLDQIIFGDFLGFGIYYFIFYIFKIKSDKGRQFLHFIKKNILLHFLFSFFPMVILALTYNIFSDHSDFEVALNEKIKACNCENLWETDMYFREGKFSLINGSLILLNYAIIFALKLEYNFVFPQKDNDWMHYNFNNDTKSMLEDSFCSDISIGEKETRWNKTNFIYSFLRLILTYVVCFSILLVFHFYELKTENISFYLMVNSLLPFSLIFFVFFNFGKIFFRNLNLSNECVIILSG